MFLCIVILLPMFAILLTIGSCKQKDKNEAAVYFEQFIEKAPVGRERIYVLYNLGQTYEQLGELNLSAEIYRSFIELAEPTNPLVKTAKAKLEKLEGATK